MIRFAFDVSTALCRDGGLREVARPWGRRWRGRKPLHIRSHRRVSAWMRANQASSVSGAGVQDLKRNDSGRGRCGLESQQRFSLFDVEKRAARERPGARPAEGSLSPHGSALGQTTRCARQSRRRLPGKPCDHSEFVSSGRAREALASVLKYFPWCRTTSKTIEICCHGASVLDQMSSTNKVIH